MSATVLQAWIAAITALLAGALGILKYFSYRTRRDRISLVGQAFTSTVEGLSSDAEAKKLAAAILLRRFFDKETEQGAAGTPYEHEAVAVIAALLRNTPTGELQKLLADGLAYASSLRGAYLGKRPRAAVAHSSLRLLVAGRRGLPGLGGGGNGQPSGPGLAVPIDLTEADLFHADLTGASLRGATARNAVFYTAVARQTVFEGAHLEGADFRDAELEGARFTGAWIERARFKGAHHVPQHVSRLLDKSGQVPAGEGMPVSAV